MQASQLALVRGLADTRETLDRWNDHPWPVLGRWAAGSALIAVALLVAVWLIATLTPPDPTPFVLPGLHTEPTAGQVGHVVARNALVLTLHALACVAGFIAGSSLPQQAEQHTGLWRTVHEKAGPLAILFVTVATGFSLFTQAFVLGGSAASLAAQLDISPALLVLGLAPHALPELVALFLPLAAWIIASRRDDWHELLAATVVTVLLAAPVVTLSAVIEVYVTPDVLRALAG
jgi:hypothetical protein